MNLSAIYTERRAVVSAVKVEADKLRDENLARVDAERAMVIERHRVDTAASVEAFARRDDELDAALARDVQATLRPLAKRFASEPRTVAVEIASAWSALTERAVEQLGVIDGDASNPLNLARVDISPLHLVWAFFAVHGDGALARAGSPRFYEHFRVSAERTIEALLSGLGAATLENVLRNIEIGVDAVNAAALEPDSARLAAMTRHTTTSRVERARDAFDHGATSQLRNERDTIGNEAAAAWRKMNAGNARALSLREPGRIAG